jgi:hypothetical protein
MLPGDDAGGAEELLPPPAGVALPSVPAPPVAAWPPVSTVVLAAMIAWRNGCTPNETLAMIAIPASTATGRSQLTVSSRTKRGCRAGPGGKARSGGGPPGRGPPGRGSRRSRGHGRAEGAGTVAGHTQESCHAQCPRQVQCLTRRRASAMTLTSHGRGGRWPILVRIRSSASARVSTSLTASVRARLSASSMPLSGAVTGSPASPRPAASWRFLGQDRLQ